MPSDTEVAVIGGGAAGIAAARRLTDAGVPCLLIEARNRLGGRAYTVNHGGHGVDLGCGWLHSAETNPFVAIAEQQGRRLDRSTPAWGRPALDRNFPAADQRDYQQATAAYFERLSELATRDVDVSCAAAFEPGNRWNGLIGAVVSYISGGDAARVSVRDFENYAGTDVNWRVAEGYGTVIAAVADGVNVALETVVERVDHSGKSVRIVTDRGTMNAVRVIITLPSDILAARDDLFFPALPQKVEAAAGLPLGLADKLYLSLAGAEEFGRETRVFGRLDTKDTASYTIRPQGRPHIEGYFGNGCAADLEKGGVEAFVDFASGQLACVFGSDFKKRLSLLDMHLWGADPFARGSYSFALPGRADCRPALAAPVDERLFFAGEACSKSDFSTAHGAYLSGLTAADQVLAARKRG
ncbi:MAG TPA: NAD(P)/FAD-dependent oxidoreductase [Pseudolabrys sp.]|jgi:monoamine oxidase|nr:NAD(P)/FAD-dependent oxidoreductase [Pseudolabrys sp.]